MRSFHLYPDIVPHPGVGVGVGDVGVGVVAFVVGTVVVAVVVIVVVVVTVVPGVMGVVIPPPAMNEVERIRCCEVFPWKVTVMLWGGTIEGITRVFPKPHWVFVVAHGELSTVPSSDFR